MKLEVQGLSFGYDGKPIGRDVGFELAPGQVLCLLGPNGSGKTTLFKTVLGLLPALGGVVRLDGEETRDWPAARLARSLGYVPQAHNAFFPFTVQEVVLMGRTAHLGLFEVPSAHDREVALASLRRLSIYDLAEAIYTRISGGQRQLTLVARALAQEPGILIMDEPTASLDFGNQMRVLEQIRELAAQGLGIILSTHDPDHAFMLADRVLMLHEGRLIADGPPREVITEASLKTLYGVDLQVVAPHPGSRLRLCAPLDRVERSG